jgi:hypothetical protein
MTLTNDELLQLVRGCAAIAVEFKLDVVSVSPTGEVKIGKAHHDGPFVGSMTQTGADDDDEDLLYGSSDA